MARRDNVKTLPTASDRNKSDVAEQVPRKALDALEQRLSERTAELEAETAERKRVEEALRASEAQMRQLTDAMPAVIAYCDAEHRYRFVNRTFETWFCRSRAAVIGKHTRDVLGRGPYEGLRPRIERALRGEQQTFEATIPFPDGVTRDLDSFYVPHVLEDGRIPGFFLMARDVSEQKRAEEALRASQDRLAGILDIAPEAVISMDDMYRITLFNQGAEAIFGYAADEILGQPLDMLMPPRFREAHHHHLRRFACSTGESRMMTGRGVIFGLRKDGSEFPAEASISQLELGGETVFTVMLRDITERTEARGALLESERQLQTRVNDLEAAQGALERQGEELVRMTEDLSVARDQAEDANRAKSEFLAHMSHELRTPLNAVIGFSEIIKSETFGPVGSPKYREYATDINASGQHLLDLINDILDLSKVESGSEELQEQDVDVSALVRSVWTLVERIAEKGEVALESEVPDALAWMRADERKFKQILLNALSNAIKFTEAGGKVTLRARCNAQSGFVFQVSDTGIGMAPEDIPKALSKFGRIDGKFSRDVQGTGLGLPLTKALVELHGGTLTLQSELGVGTTLTVSLPASRIVPPSDEPAQGD